MNIKPDVSFHPFEIAFCGFSGTGKTTLVSRLVSFLGKNYSIGYYKHGCHRFDIDREGKDSNVVRQSGATTVMLSDPEKHALLGRDNPGPLLMKCGMLHVDFLLVEGLKELPLPKLVLVDRDMKILDLINKNAVANVIALVAENPELIPAPMNLRVFQRDDIEGIAGFIMDFFYRRINRKPLFGLVLAGGKSSRMGQDKALIAYHEENQIVQTTKMLLKHCPRVYVSCRPDQQSPYRKYDIPLVTDSYLDIGPLGGLLSAQRLFPETPWLVTACDQPFLEHSFLEELTQKRNPFSFATAYRHHNSKKPEPLCTIYEPKSRAPLLLRHAAGSNSLRSFLEEFPIHYLSVKEPCCLQNVNTPEERLHALNTIRSGKRTQ